MWQWASANSNTKRTLRIIIVVCISLVVMVIYSRSGVRNHGYTSYFPLPRNVTKVLTNVSKPFYNSTKQYSAADEKRNVNLELIVDKAITKENNYFVENTVKSTKYSQSTKGDDQVEYTKSSENNFTDTYIKHDTQKDSKTKIYTDVINGTELDGGVNNTSMYFIEEQDTTEFPQRDISDIHRTPNTWNKFNNKLSSRKSTPASGKWLRLQQKQFKRNFVHKNHLLPDRLNFDKTAYDIMSMKPINFDTAYKNPCWRGDGKSGLFEDGKLHCLPYYYLIGVKKSGTTDFMSRMSKHPEYCRPRFNKESQWFARLRFGINPRLNMVYKILRKGYDLRKAEFFASLFDEAATCISQKPSIKGNNTVRYRMITAEASPSTFHMHTNWELLPGNENRSEPQYTNFHYIKHLTPDVKIIILLRDPTTRLYSDFLHTTGGKYLQASPRVFHQEVMILIKAYKNCFTHSTERSCVYNNTLKEELRQKVNIHGSFNAGFYAVFMRDLLSVFGNTQILPILMTDYVTKMEKTLRKAFSFLDMGDVSVVKMKQMLKSGPKNVSKKKKAVTPMLKMTRDLLYEFYKPYNEEMAQLMGDSRYLFPKT